MIIITTETALLSVTDELLKDMDEKKVSILVLMDMSKAFESRPVAGVYPGGFVSICLKKNV